jgi:hypothetical protein
MVAAGATLQAISPDMLPRIWRISWRALPISPATRRARR